MARKKTTRKNLTERERRFAEIVVWEGLSGARAAIQAGFSKSSASKEATRLLARPIVRKHIVNLREELHERTLARDIEQRFLQRAVADALLHTAKNSLTPYFDPRTGFDWQAMTEAGVEVEEIRLHPNGTLASVKLLSPSKARDQLAKALDVPAMRSEEEWTQITVQLTELTAKLRDGDLPVETWLGWCMNNAKHLFGSPARTRLFAPLLEQVNRSLEHMERTELHAMNVIKLKDFEASLHKAQNFYAEAYPRDAESFKRSMDIFFSLLQPMAPDLTLPNVEDLPFPAGIPEAS